MQREPVTVWRAALIGTLGGALVAVLVLSATTSVWFLMPVPVLAAAVYAAAVGMTPSRFADALDDRGTGTSAPF